MELIDTICEAAHKYSSLLKKEFGITLDLTYVTAGQFTSFWKNGLEPSITPTNKPIIEKAKKQITYYFELDYLTYLYRSMTVSNIHLHKKIIDFLKEDLL